MLPVRQIDRADAMNRDKIDPDVLRFIDTVTGDWARYPTLSSLSFPEARAVAEKVRARWVEGGPQMADTREQVVTTSEGALRIRVYYPKGAPSGLQPALVYLHGGGFTLFSIDTHDRLMREYAEQGGFVVIGVDYPLSPEAKYPVALNRIAAFMRWLADHAPELGIDPARIAMGGDSAGGNLSVSTCLKLRDSGEVGIVRAILSNYGGFSGLCSDEAEALYGGPGAVLNRAESEYFYGNYLNDSSEFDDPYACPGHADVRGLPPTFLVIPEIDIIAEQSVAMAESMQKAGVETSSKVYLGATHSFLEAMSISAVAREAIADGAAFIRSKLA